MQLAEFILLQLSMFLFLMNPYSVLYKITLLLMQYATSFLLCNRSFRSVHGGIVIYTEILVVRLHITFLHFTARNRCGAYNPDIY